MFRKDHKDTDHVTISLRVLGRFARIVHEAAERNGQTAQDFMLEVVLTRAADDLGITLPPNAIKRPSMGEVGLAAKQLGISPEEFIQQAAREAAAALVSKHGSGTRKAVRA